MWTFLVLCLNHQLVLWLPMCVTTLSIPVENYSYSSQPPIRNSLDSSYFVIFSYCIHHDTSFQYSTMLRCFHIDLLQIIFKYLILLALVIVSQIVLHLPHHLVIMWPLKLTMLVSQSLLFLTMFGTLWFRCYKSSHMVLHLLMVLNNIRWRYNMSW